MKPSRKLPESGIQEIRADIHGRGARSAIARLPIKLLRKVGLNLRRPFGFFLAVLLLWATSPLLGQPVIRRPGQKPPDGPTPLPPGAEPDASSNPNPSSPGDSRATLPLERSFPSSTNANVTGKSDSDKDKIPPTEDIQVTFQGANIDMIVQWLAQTTGKSVVKHPKVQCQLTIMGSKKLPPREAVILVYRALALEGFTVIESAKSILIVPEGQEPKMSPELLPSAANTIPEGRERLMKIFTLKHMSPSEMKEKIKVVLSDKASVDADDRAGQIMVTDYNDNLLLAGDLITALDSDNPLDIAVRVIPLKNVNAQDLVKEVTPLYQKMSGKSAKDAVEIAANDRSNSLLVLSSAANFEAIEKVIAGLDTEDAQERTMQTFPLKNADAQDVAKQLQDLYQDQDNSSRYPFFIFTGNNPGKNGKKINVVADRRRNTLVVQAPPSAMESLAKMIAALDEPVNDDSLAPKIYPLKYVSAGDIEDLLNELFLKKTQQRNYWNPFGDYEPTATADRDVGRLYGKVRITSEPHSNSLIITANSAENLAAVEEVVKALDTPSEAGESTFRIGLRFAKAVTVANSINILFAKNGSPPLRPVSQPNQPGANVQQPQQQGQQNQPTSSQTDFGLEQETQEDHYFPWLGGQPDNNLRTGDSRTSIRPASDLVGRVRVVPDERSNSLLISANVHFFPQVLKLIEDLDAPTAQVLIEARILEVSTDFLEKLGVRWSPNGQQVFTPDDYDNSFLVQSTGSYTKGFGGTTTANGPSGTVTPPVGTSTIASELASLRSGVLSSTISMDFLIQFLRKHTDATVLAAPQINIEDNETGKIFVGQQVPFIDNTVVQAQGGQNQSFTYKDVGVILEVTPHINVSGDVSLKIHAESSEVVAGQLILGGAVINTRNFKTDLEAKSGQTLVLGGIIQKQVSDTVRKTPVLGSIPGLGWAFKKKDKTTSEVELMVFLRPKVVRTPEEAKELLHDVEKQAPLIKKWEQEPHPVPDADKPGTEEKE
jgi:type II secretion system protein D